MDIAWRERKGTDVPPTNVTRREAILQKAAPMAELLEGGLVMTMTTTFRRLALAAATSAALWATTPAAAAGTLADALAEGKAQTDLGQFDLATRAFQTVIDAPDATPAQKAEALIRLGAARRGAGDHEGALKAFERASKAPGLDRELKGVLVRAVGGALPADARWEKIWAEVSFTADRSNPKEPTLVVAWPGITRVGRYKGQRIVVDHKDADLQDLFRLFADISSLNVVVFPGVSGKVTFKANEKPWDWCLEQMIAANGLTYRWNGEVLLIGKPEHIGTAQQFSGKAVTLDYKDRDLREAFADLATTGGATVDVAPEIKGRVTIKLTEVPWDQAFDVIVKTNGLDWSRDGSALKVFPKPRPGGTR